MYSELGEEFFMLTNTVIESSYKGNSTMAIEQMDEHPTITLFSVRY